ncbi:hypothetical protein [Rhodococcus sp. P1Y]|uniref:hypothetical protein n=1 Tax=Rhodococcus sp. P1Y TaxID=1302308 RepID=UPI000EB3442F|nr:hypothetical protein [Rhodococcus sp. P1Y]AYJ48105.1 hypothetical protein D8W71_06890 [Rhodococcus sp. P1Y]
MQDRPAYSKPSPSARTVAGKSSNHVEPLSALDQRFIGKWAANTTYAVGQSVVSPAGDVVKASSAHTSTGSYDSTKWDLTITFASNRDALGSASPRMTKPQGPD